MTHSLYIIRGLPGSGKSALAEKLSEWIVNDDDYYEDDDGNYKYEDDMFVPCHKWMYEYCKYLMDCNVGDIVVTSPFPAEYLIEPFSSLAKEKGYILRSIIMENRHNGESVHGVPKWKILEMKSEFNIRL